jgi:hypothetical protein
MQPDDNDGNAGRALPQPAARALPDLPPPLPDLPPPLPNLPAAPEPGRTFSLEQVLAWGGAAAAPDGANLAQREVRCVLCCSVQATGRRSRAFSSVRPLVVAFNCGWQDYLSDAAFEAAFGMPREQYTALPKWKQTTAKREAGLF